MNIELKLELNIAVGTKSGDFAQQRLSNDPVLVEKYNQDLEKNKIETILKYLVEWNEK